MTYSDDLKIKIFNFIKSKKFTALEIMKMFNISNTTFYKIKNDPKLRGGSKYSRLKSHKRNPKIENSVKKFIVKYVTTKGNFNYKKLIKIINSKFNITISKSSIYNILKENKVTRKKVHKKMTSVNAQRRKKQVELFKAQIDEALTKSSIDNIISIDESSIDSHLCNNYGWSYSGTKIENVKGYYRIRYSLILAISCKKIIHMEIIKGSANGEIFLKFMEDLVKKLQTKKDNYVILDNARIHHYKKVKEFVSKKPNITLIYNIPYTPETNPIERVFNDIKCYLRKKEPNNNNITDLIKKSLNAVNKNNLRKYFKKSLIEELGKIK